MNLQWNEYHTVVRAARRVTERLRQAGHQAFWVGGCVRDCLLGIEPKDIDIATDATPATVQALFKKNNTPVGAHFGVILVTLDNINIEVATFRIDGEYRDARHPESVIFGTVEQDAARRDFTINALYYDPATGQIHDLVGGLADLHARTLRAIGNPTLRFREDALRLLRAIRFATRFGLQIEPDTHDAIRHNASRIADISAERIRDELIRMFTGPAPGHALRLLENTGLLHHVLPEIANMKGTPQPEAFHPEGDVFEHTVLALEAMPPAPSPTLAFGTLLHDIGKPPTIEFADRIRFNQHHTIGAEMADTIGKRLRFSNADRKQIVALVENHMAFMHVQEMRPARLKRLLTIDAFDEHLELHRADCLASHGALDNYDFCRRQLDELKHEKQSPALPPPLLNGHDLIDAGYLPGPRMGEMLEAARDAQLNGELNEKKESIDWIKERFGDPKPT